MRNGFSETLSGELNPASSQDTAARPRAPLAALGQCLPPGQPPQPALLPGAPARLLSGPRASFSLFALLALLPAAVSFSHLKELLLFERRCASPREKPARATQTEPPAALHWGQGHGGAQPQKQRGKGSVRLVAHGCAHGSVSLPGTSDPPERHRDVPGVGEAWESNSCMKGDQGSLGTDRDQHCCLLCGEMSLSPKDKSTHHLFLESALDMARATTLLQSRRGRGGDGNYPWSIPPPEHWAEMVSGSDPPICW